MEKQLQLLKDINRVSPSAPDLSLKIENRVAQPKKKRLSPLFLGENTAGLLC